jgi:tetratricopeptide (TPR) repeat protein
MAEIGRFNRSFELLHEYESVISESAISGNDAAIPSREVYLLTRMGEAAKAVDLARTSLRDMTSASDSLTINLALIEALAAAGSVKEARLLLSAVLKLDETQLWGPRRYRALLSRSIVALAEGDPEGALKAIRETEKTAKPSVFLRYGVAYRETLARAYWKSRRLKEAVRAYQNLLSVFGGHTISHYELRRSLLTDRKRPADHEERVFEHSSRCVRRRTRDGSRSKTHGSASPPYDQTRRTADSR